MISFFGDAMHSRGLARAAPARSWTATFRHLHCIDTSIQSLPKIVHGRRKFNTMWLKGIISYRCGSACRTKRSFDFSTSLQRGFDQMLPKKILTVRLTFRKANPCGSGELDFGLVASWSTLLSFYAIESTKKMRRREEEVSVVSVASPHALQRPSA